MVYVHTIEIVTSRYNSPNDSAETQLGRGVKVGLPTPGTM